MNDTKDSLIKLSRPNLFHFPEVSGILIPEKKIEKDEIAGSWLLYVNYKEAGRKVLVLKKNIPLPDNSFLWFDPIPATPSISDNPQWSKEGRLKWLDGYIPDVAKLFDDLVGLFRYYIDFPPQEAETSLAILALWTMFTYAYPAWDAVPYLNFSGSLGSGKSTVFDILMQLIWRAIVSSSMTAPCLFRTLGNEGGTLLFDEAERLKGNTNDAGDLLPILLSGYRKRAGKARRLEPVDNTFVSKEFDVYCPKALAGVAQIPPALISRCIRFNMIRAGRDSDVIRHRIQTKLKDFQRVRDDLHAFTLCNGQRFLELVQDFSHCGGMLGRDIEIWQPLMAMATLVEESFGKRGLIELLKTQAEKNNEDGEAVPQTDSIVLKCLLKASEVRKPMTASQVLEAVRFDDDNLFKKYSPRGISVILKRYGIQSTASSHNKKLFLVDADKAEEIEQKYGLSLDESDE